MTYFGKSQRSVLLLLLIWAVTSIFTSSDYPSIYYILIPYTLFILAFILMHFKLTIIEDSMTFEVILFTLPIYKKEVNYNQIDSVKLKRVGWATKCAIVKNRQGFNFRVTNFYPGEVYDDLINFADEHNIPLSKTKDYLILERMSQRVL